MAITPWFMADPPQYTRTKTLGVTDGVYCALGDRWGYRNLDTVYTYKCTTAGAPGVSWTPGGTSPYTFGSSVWTLVTPDSWANATICAQADKVIYIDCESMFPYMEFDAMYYRSDPFARCIVSVEPTTMRPRNMRVSEDRYWNVATNLAPDSGFQPAIAFFGPVDDTNFHGRQRFGDPNPFLRFKTSNPPTPRIDIRGTFTSPNFSWTNRDGSRGMNLTYLGGDSMAMPSTGVAITLNAPNLSSISGSIIPSTVEDARRFGLHTNHGLSAVLAPSYKSVGARNLFQTMSAYVSENSSPMTHYGEGSACTLAKRTTTYRDGAATGGDEAFSFQWAGNANASYGAMWMTPFIYLQNTLTGSRTITVHFVTDSPFTNDITNADVWIDCFYPSSNTTPKYSFVSSENSNWGAPACSKTQVPTDSATWTTPTIYFPTSFKLQVTCTIQKAGMLLLRMCCASQKLSRYIVYMCPYIDIA